MGFFDYILKLDHFGKAIELTFGSQKKIHTLIGCISTVIVYGMIIGLSISQFTELIVKEKPKSNIVNKYNVMAPDLYFKDENIIIAFGATDPDFNVINDTSIISYSVTNLQMNRSNGTTTTKRVNVPIIPCSNYMNIFNKQGFQKEYTNNYLDTYLCFNTSELKGSKLKIGGSFSGDYYSLIQISVSKCNKTTTATCKTVQEIDQKLTRNFFQVYYLNTYVDTQDYKSPFNYIFDKYITRIDPHNYKNTNLFFMRVNVTSDSGFMFEDYTDIYSYQKDYYNENTSPDVVDNEIFRMGINSSFNNLVYYRYYTKIQDIFANIGGLLKFLLLISDMCVAYISIYKRNQYFIDSLFVIKSTHINTNTNNANLRIGISNDNSTIPINNIRNKNEVSQNNYLHGQNNKGLISI